MSIIKNTPHYLKHSKKTFTTIQNETIELITDPSTLGIYVYLSAKPDNWEISVTNLMNRFQKCRDFIRARMSNLRELGLLESVAIKNDKGQIIHWEKVLYSEPQPHLIDKYNHESTLLENQAPGKPGDWKTRRMEKPPTTNKRCLTNKRDLKNKQAVIVFSCSQDVKNHINLVLTNRKETIEETLIDEIVFYVGDFKDYDEVIKKINIALKKVREGKWNIPHGYKGLTTKSIRKEEEIEQERKIFEAIQDANAYKVIKKIVANDKPHISIKDRLEAYRESLESNADNAKSLINPPLTNFRDNNVGCY